MIDARSMLRWSDELHETWWRDLEALDEELLAENREASFRSILGILTHMANVENAWMDVVEGHDPDWARHSTRTWSTLEPVRGYMEKTRQRTWSIVGDLPDEELTGQEHPAGGPFAKEAFTAEEVLFTIVTHECFHRGEVLALLWQRDIEPPVCDYPAYATPLR